MNRLVQRSKISQALQRYQVVNRRHVSQNGAPFKPPKTDAPTKPVAPEQKKRSGFGFGSLVLLLGAGSGSLYYLALKVQEEDPIALHVAEQPGVSTLVAPFLDFVTGGRNKIEPPRAPVEDKPLNSFSYEVKVEEESPAPVESSEPVTESNSTDLSATEQVVPDFTEEEIQEIVNADVELAPSHPTEHHQQSEHSHAHEQVVTASEEVSQVTEHQHHHDHHHVHHEGKADDCGCETSHHDHHHHATIAPETTPVEPAPPSTVSQAESSTGELLLPLTLAEQSLQNVRTSQETVGEVLTNVSRNSIALRKELEAVLLKDIHNLNADALRIRITQLVGELFERLSWESIRISQSVLQVEKELNDKYNNLLNQQRKEFELQLNTLLLNKEKEIQNIVNDKQKEYEIKYSNDLQTTIKSQAEGFQQTLNNELEKQAKLISTELIGQFQNHIANLQKQYNDTVNDLLNKITTITSEVKAFENIINTTEQYLYDSKQTHKLSSAILGLELLLTHAINHNTKNTINKKLNDLIVLSNNDSLITSIIKSIPVRVQENGVLTLSELQIRFKILHDEVREVALAPENTPTFIGQTIGKLLAKVTIAPVGNASGDGVEETMARAAYQLEKGNIQQCLNELNSIKGYSSVLMKDWKLLANDRLVVDQALQALKADSLIRHRSFR